MKLKILFSFALLGTFLISCTKFLEEPYDNRLELKAVENYRDLAASAYPERQDLFTDILTDDYHHYASTMQASLAPTYLPIYLYKDDYVEGTATPSTAYPHYYKKIYLANNIISEVMDAEGDVLEKKAVLGEALLIRAYCYFTLVNLFGMHYDAATNATNLGVPLITDVPTANRPLFKRNTVKEVYEQIDVDMKEGLELLLEAKSIQSTNPYHFSLASAYAFFSRVNLYKGNWEECEKYASLAVEDRGPIIRNLAADIAVLGATSIANFALQFMDPSVHKNILLAQQTATFLTRPTGFRLCGFYPSHSLYYNYFPSTDLRFRLFSAGGTVIDSVTNYVKYAQQPNQPNVGVSRYECFTMEEVFLNRAEAALRKAVPNIGQAMADMDVIRAARLTNYAPTNVASQTVTSALNLVMTERRKEFLGQGMRWFDIKRLGLRVEHRLSRTSPQADVVLESDDKRKALQIPISARVGNPELENQLNPR
ncbi:RagB/SusD family nutrient uptake outer membrane protein [Niabella sp. 22666]|uniref:RagB/SusD family nutrient uptake outer membrane protein n=1 Tax=Niabella sp. 22666 TaxID=3453954 RepID=UPI003F850726